MPDRVADRARAIHFISGQPAVGVDYPYMFAPISIAAAVVAMKIK
jgi:hypothetical protein